MRKYINKRGQNKKAWNDSPSQWDRSMEERKYKQEKKTP